MKCSRQDGPYLQSRWRSLHDDLRDINRDMKQYHKTDIVMIRLKEQESRLICRLNEIGQEIKEYNKLYKCNLLK